MVFIYLNVIIIFFFKNFLFGGINEKEWLELGSTSDYAGDS